MRSTVWLGVLLLGGGSSAWPSKTYKTENFISPVFKISGSAPSNVSAGYLFLGLDEAPKDERGPIIVDTTGELVWHGGLPSNIPRANNFQVQTFQNSTVLTYWEGIGYHFKSTPAHGYGSVSILNHHYEPIYKDVCLPPEVNSDINPPIDYPPKQCFIDGHESYITPGSSSLIVTVYNTTQTNLEAFGGPKNGWIFDVLFYELDVVSNKVLYSWSALKHIPLTASNNINTTGPNKLRFGNTVVGGSRKLPWDPFHINSVQSIPGGYLVNSRMTWSFYIVDGKSGKIQHTIEGSKGGDFKLDPDVYFSWQHHARLHSTSKQTMYISLFDNDNIPSVTAVNKSSGYFLAVDTHAKTVSKVYHLQDSSQFIISFGEGSYQNLSSGNALIGYGAQPVIQEFDVSNPSVPIYSAQFAEGGSNDTHTGTHTYRAYLLDWVGKPKTLPKVVASYHKAKSSNVHVAMSWNGATEHVAWKILAGKNADAHTVTRTGFETLYSFKPDSKKPPRRLKVQALDKNGNVLAVSKAVKIKS